MDCKYYQKRTRVALGPQQKRKIYQIWGCHSIDLQEYLGGVRIPFTEQSENTAFASS